MKVNKIRIAIQKSGRLEAPSEKYLASLGLKFKKNGKNLIVPCRNSNIEILYVRNSDIPEYVKQCVAEFGIVGENILKERKTKLEIIKKLGFGLCSLVIAVPKNSQIKKIKDLEGERIATSYPNTLKKYLKENKINAVVIEIKGSTEIAPSLNLADAICDITQTGNTLKENNLRPITIIFKSEAVLIKNPSTYENILFQ